MCGGHERTREHSIWLPAARPPILPQHSLRRAVRMSWRHLSRPILFGRLSSPDTTWCAIARSGRAVNSAFALQSSGTSIFRIWVSLSYLSNRNCNRPPVRKGFILLTNPLSMTVFSSFMCARSHKVKGMLR